MHLEIIWNWLDAVDEENLDPLDQWGASPQTHSSQDFRPGGDYVSSDNNGRVWEQRDEERSADVAGHPKSTQPTGLLLRNGSVRLTGEVYKTFAYDAEKENYPEALIPGFPTSGFRNENPAHSTVPGIVTKPGGGTRQQPNASSTRQLQASGREGNKGSANPKRLPNYPDRTRARGLSGAMLSTPISHVDVEDPVAINCQVARVLGAYRQSGLQDLPSATEKFRRNTAAGAGSLRRSNAFKRPSKVRPDSDSRPKK